MSYLHKPGGLFVSSVISCVYAVGVSEGGQDGVNNNLWVNRTVVYGGRRQRLSNTRVGNRPVEVAIVGCYSKGC